jgi:hypothetical protein
LRSSRQGTTVTCVFNGEKMKERMKENLKIVTGKILNAHISGRLELKINQNGNIVQMLP